ncbi:hypothetical protein Lepto7375DRAFT_4970 [Leptolyngbya sp. PCC 7375]|nr:hypothetical protein Lepto7375DRAFT_4970 [Leptolyngbya sp. PCC 7375]
MAEENILNANTIAALITAVNDHYQTDFPDLFPTNSPLSPIWNTNISVKTGNGEGTDFSAEGELVTFPFSFADQVEDPTFAIKAKIAIVTQSSAT